MTTGRDNFLWYSVMCWVEELFESSPVLSQFVMGWVGDIVQEIINENLAA